jgi:long-chain acyl-CoA synthetase
VAVIAQEFTIDSGMLTPTLKIRRKIVEQRYQDVIHELYAGRTVPE